MRAIVNPLHDPGVDALWAEADGVGAPAIGGKFLRYLLKARQRGGPRAALKVKRIIEQRRVAPVQLRAKWMPRPVLSPFVAPVPTIVPVARAPVRRRRRIGWAKRRAWRGRKFGRRMRPALRGRRGRFGLDPLRWRQLTRQYEGGLSGIECDELEGLAGMADDETFTLGDDLGDLGGFFSKVKKAFKKVAKVVKKVHKKTFKVVKKIVKSKAFKIAAIAAAAWFAGPLVIAKLAAMKGITPALARAALKRGAQRLGKTGAVEIGATAATNAAPAPAEAVDYQAIMEMGLQPDDKAAVALARPMADPTTMAVPGETGGPKMAGMTGMVGLVIGGGLLAAVLMGGGPRRR